MEQYLLLTLKIPMFSSVKMLLTLLALMPMPYRLRYLDKYDSGVSIPYGLGDNFMMHHTQFLHHDQKFDGNTLILVITFLAIR